LGGHPRGGDLAAIVAGLDAGQQPRPPVVGEVLSAAAQHASDALQWFAAPSPVPVSLLLDAAAHVIDCGQCQPDDVEGILHPYRVGQPG
jgi:hypothetical protein